MPVSILEAIEKGWWDFEPEEVNSGEFDSTRALPGTNEKIKLLAERIQSGLPLWHPQDRRSFDESDD